MSSFLELPEFPPGLTFRTLMNQGMDIVYPHFHKEIEFIYAEHGTVNIGVGDEVVQVEQGDCFFFSSGEPHYFLASPDSVRLVYQFDLKLFDEVALRKDEQSLFQLFENGEPHSKNWPASLKERIIPLLLAIYRDSNQPSPGMNFRIVGMWYQLVGYFYQELPQVAISKKASFPADMKYQTTLQQLNRVFKLVEEHFAETLTLEEVAAAAGFSPYYFTRFFKKNTGQTFVNFLTEYRITQAKFILANEKIPMVDVAEKAGFPSVKTFHHVFKKAMGISPLKYQKQLLEGSLEKRSL